MAFLRYKRKKQKGVAYEYWSLVETVRTPRGPRQRTLATIGKAPGLDEEERIGWEDVAEQISGRPRGRGSQGDLFMPSPPPSPDWATVDLSRVRVERLRRFGDVYLGIALWNRLRLDEFFSEQIPEGREEIAWSQMACAHTIARFCEPSSDLALVESFYDKTALDDLLHIPSEKVNADRVYRALDVMVSCRDRLFEHLRARYGEMFSSDFDVLLYDITSTYFEGSCERNEKAARGYSRDSRPDCLQVCIGLVVTPEGLPLAYEVFEGNRPDVACLEDIFDLMEERYGKARRTFVLDRGIVSEVNLAALRRRGASYIVGTPRAALKQCEKALLDKGWDEVEPGIEVKILHIPDGEDEEGEEDPGGEERYVLCRSRARIEKDRAIVARAAERLEKGLRTLQEQLARGRQRDRARAERRVGRLLEKYSRAARLFRVRIEEMPDDVPSVKKRLRMILEKDVDAQEWVALQNGCYLLRTNLVNQSAKDLWRAYMGLTEAESSFRELKSPLSLRPVYHQKTERVEAHIFVAFCALCLRRVLACWMETCGLGAAPRKVLEEMRTIHSLDIVLHAKEGSEIRLRVVSTPEPRVRDLLHHLGLKIPNRPKRIQNVVPKIDL